MVGIRICYQFTGLVLKVAALAPVPSRLELAGSVETAG
jgi:hypothetical protein